MSNHRTLVYADKLIYFVNDVFRCCFVRYTYCHPSPSLLSLKHTCTCGQSLSLTYSLTSVCVFSQKEKVKNFKRQIIKYLEAQLKAQQQVSLCSDGV